MATAALPAGHVEALLGDWQRLNAELMSLPLSGVQELLEAEVTGRCRTHVVSRIYGRFNRLRHIEDIARLLSGEVPWRDTEWHQSRR